MTIRKRVITALLLFAYCFLMGGQIILSAFSVKAAAAETTTSLDNTSVMSDLGEVTEANFPYNPTGDCQVIYVTEYCYSDCYDYSSIYNVYIYVYNPSQKPILTTADNSVNMAVDFNDNGTAKAYANVSITCLDYSSNHRFYKFKLTDSSAMLAEQKEYAKNNSGKRSYEIIGIQVTFRGNINATDSSVSTKYVFSGYAAGCAEDKSAVSSLMCEDYGVNSIYLEVNNTYYRFAELPDGKNRDELNSVYFSLPKEYFDKWGQLVEFTAEWYEYKTKPMLVTNYEEAYSALVDVLGMNIDSEGYEIDRYWVPVHDSSPDTPHPYALKPNPENGYYEWRRVDNVKDTNIRVFWDLGKTEVYIEEVGSVSFDIVNKSFAPGIDVDNKTYIHVNDPEFIEGATAQLYINRFGIQNCIYWLFYAPGASGKDSWHVSSDEVVDYLQMYSFANGSDNLILGKYASELFEETLDVERLAYLTEMAKDEDCIYDEETGYVKMTFDNFDDSFGYTDINKSQSAWNKFWFGTEYINESIEPIIVISEYDLVLSESAFAEKYKINSYDVKDVIKYAKESYDNDEIPIICRFALTNYYSTEAVFDNIDENKDANYDVPNGYVAQESVFLNFDVISLGFQNKNGDVRTIIGVVSNPIDIINGLDAPEGLVDNSDNWLLAILGVLVLIVIIMVLGPIISPILNVVFSVLLTGIKAVLTGLSKVLGFLIGILTLPFRLLWRLLFGRD